LQIVISHFFQTIREQAVLSRVHHIIIDNMQFLCGSMSPTSHVDRFGIQVSGKNQKNSIKKLSL
jgi:hypothetical protein